MRIRLVVVGLLATLVTSTATAAVQWLGGEGPPFVFAANGTGSLHPGDTLTVVLAVGGRYYGKPRVDFHLAVPKQLGFLSGDTAVALPLDKAEGNYTLRLLPTEHGSFEIRGQLQIDAQEQHDVAEFVMPVVVEEDTVLVEHSRYTLLESTRQGQRYRYGDWWLIPLETDEAAVVEADIEKYGKKTRAGKQEVATCADCPPAAAPDTVNFLVVVDKYGKLRELQVWGLRISKGKPKAAVIDAAKASLRKWQFEPAVGKGQPVSDWLYVSVPVVPQK